MTTTATYPAGSADLRLTARGRVVLVMVFLAVMFVLLTLAGARSAATPAGVHPSPREAVVLQPGQTLWDVAVAARPGVDPRSTIERILDLNGLSGGGDVPIGQRLRLPPG